MTSVGGWLSVARAMTVGIALALAASRSGAQTLFFSAFDQDDTGYFDIEFGAPDVQATFDTTLGSPTPGSLRLSRTTTALPAQLVSPCLEISETRRLTLTLDARSDSVGTSCSIGVFLHDEPACLDSPGIVPVPPAPPPGPKTATEAIQTWESLEKPFAGSEVVIPPLRIRFVLNLLPSAAPAACNFDNIRIVSEQVESIPAATAWGRSLLLATVAAVGLWMSRRRS